MAIFGVIGVGNMGYPLLKAAIKTFGADEVLYYDPSAARRQEVLKETGLSASQDNISVVLTANTCYWL